ncbi:Phytanoyl-CoA dioxygenase [Parvibaculum lavamentivorans DS-1]|uniref:Phytanoyl-CoA dioxygenase n=1 Tax=Parvibaculum lavamentivorans (strain DS-1 / DSM 13023 / NCIMB 13966) TaxID=402881 RepID=A7HRE2_PARL1|nr:phytanoyl-CoA dioxygenase family protein [Parvibaculum lavamentivorans]ABS62475.1 Phytanoyl-CoA dioxygenase [Parvibaculum lavamentivorans DS-1]
MTTTMEKLPRARSVAEAKQQLTEHGLTIMEDVLDAEGIARVRAALKRGIEADNANGVQLHGFSFDPDTLNTRVFNLIGKDQVFRDLVQHPAAVELVRYLLDGPFLLSNFSANVTAPGSGAMGMHADQGYVPAPWPSYPLAINVAWALDDFTVENGATRFVPGSHLKDHGPGKASERAQTVPIICKAGSIFVMDGRVWHQTGPNTSGGDTRAGLFAYYVRPFIRPQWNWYLTLAPEVVRGASPLLREMLGYERNPTGDLQTVHSGT